MKSKNITNSDSIAINIDDEILNKDYFGNLIIGSLLIAGFFISFFNVFETGLKTLENAKIIVNSIFVFGITTYENRLFKYVSYGIFGVFILLLAGLLLKMDFIYQGFLMTLNYVSDKIYLTFLKNLNRLKVTASDVYVMIFMVLFSIVCGFAVRAMLKKGRILILLIVNVFFAGLFLDTRIIVPKDSALTDFNGSIATFIGITLMVSAVLMSIIKHNMEKENTGSTNKVLFTVAATVFGISFLGFLAFYYLFGSQADSDSPVANLKESILNYIDDARYGGGVTDSMPQGNFIGLSKLELSEDMALKVTMSQPESLYLKGFTGSVYTGTGWKDLDSSVYFKNQDLFYWLAKDGFSSKTQLGSLNSKLLPFIAKDEEISDDTKSVLNAAASEPISVEVENVNAYSGCLYLPYELNSEVSDISGANNFSDALTLSKGITGCKKYSFATSKYLISSYPFIAGSYYKASEKKELKKYKKDEENYNKFVYENYLDVPKEADKAIEKVLGVKKIDTSKGKHYLYEDASALITDFLNNYITYSRRINTYKGSTDFLEDFLLSSAKGYSVHYATAAALMYRHLGIPSRYVEGYLITPGMERDSTPGVAFKVKGASAHAWVEIYQDGIGWIPMEFTPPYVNIMERPSATMTSGKGGKGEGAGEAEEEEVTQEEEEKDPEKEKQEKQELAVKWTAIIGGSVLGLLILSYVVFFCLKRRELKKRLNSFKDVNVSVAIGHIYAYILDLLKYNKIIVKGGSHLLIKDQLEDTTDFDEVFKIVNEAVYSNHSLEENAREKLLGYLDKTRKYTLKKQNIFKKFKMRFVDFII